MGQNTNETLLENLLFLSQQETDEDRGLFEKSI
jgi:hypothetical protein